MIDDRIGNCPDVCAKCNPGRLVDIVRALGRLRRFFYTRACRIVSESFLKYLCRKKKPLNARGATSAQENQLQRRLGNLFAKRLRRSAKASTAHGRRSRQLPLVFRRRDELA